MVEVLPPVQISLRKGVKPNNSIQPANARGKTVIGTTDSPKEPPAWHNWAHVIFGAASLVPGLNIISTTADVGLYAWDGDGAGALTASLGYLPGGEEARIGLKTAEEGADLYKGAHAAEELREGENVEKAGQDAEKAEQEGGESVKEDEKQEQKECPLCSKKPVVLHSGVKIVHDTDFALPGVLPIELTRSYTSDMDFDGPLGRNRISPLDATLTQGADGTLLYRMGTDRTTVFDRPSPNPGVTSRGKGFPSLFLSAGRRGGFHLKDDAIVKHFVKCKDGVCRLAETRDLNDNTITFHREADGRLTRIERSDGFVFLFENDAQGRRTAITLRAPTGEARLVTRYAYDARGNLIEARNSYAKSRRYEYDAANRFLAYDDGVNERCEYVWDDADRVVAVRTPGGRFDHTLSYEPDRRATTLAYTARPDAVTRYTFDEHGMTLTETNGLGHVRRYERNAKGTLLAELDGEGNRTAYSYDAFGNVRSVTDPEGRRTTYHYNADGRLERLVDAAGNVWTWEHDACGNLVATRDPLGFRTDISNDAAGLPTATMRHDGLIEQRVYDAQHNLVRLVDFRGGVTRYERDGFGRVVASIDPLGHATRYAYAETPGADFWTATSTTRPDGVVVARKVDVACATVEAVDGEGRRTIHRYGPFSQLEQIEDPKGGKLRMAYDYESRLVCVTNQLGRNWTFERDAAGRVERETNFDGMVISYTYDRADRLKERRYEDGSRIELAYDLSGLNTRLDGWEPGAIKPDVTRYRRDRRGFLANVENAAASIHFERDGNGRVVAETCHGRRVESTYDCCGNRTSRRIDDRIVQNDYDPMGNVQRSTIGDHSSLLFTNDFNGRESRRINAQGFRVDQQWDAVGQLTRQTSAMPSSATRPRSSELASPTLDRAYEWGASFAPTAIIDERWGRTRFKYDGNSQVTQAVHDDQALEIFDYDLTRNVVASSDSLGEMQAWTTDNSGRVSEAKGPNGEWIRLTYDVRRRVVERRILRDGFRPKTWRYQWNSLDHLVVCETPDGEIWRYGYDGFGRRVWKEKDLTPGEQRFYAVSHPRLIDIEAVTARVDARAAQRSRLDDNATYERDEPPAIGTSFLWDSDVVAEEAPRLLDGSTRWASASRWYYEARSFRPLAKEDADSNLFLFVCDYLGTPQALFDEHGNLRWSMERWLWGGGKRMLSANDEDTSRPARLRAGETGKYSEIYLSGLPPDEAPNIPGFQGQSADAETGLRYNRFRYYDSLVAGYVSPDPSGILGGYRKFAFVANPLSMIDPLGLAGKTYQTYTKTNPTTGDVYSGRTSGCCDPEQNVANRDRNHHMNDQGYGPAELDQSSTNPDAIRGREQQLIDANGGAQSTGGTSGNAINGISPSNPKGPGYMGAAHGEFGGGP